MKLVNKLFCFKEYEKVVKVNKINNVASKNMVENNLHFSKFILHKK